MKQRVDGGCTNNNYDLSQSLSLILLDVLGAFECFI